MLAKVCQVVLVTGNLICSNPMPEQEALLVYNQKYHQNSMENRETLGAPFVIKDSVHLSAAVLIEAARQIEQDTDWNNISQKEYEIRRRKISELNYQALEMMEAIGRVMPEVVR
jgi:hypothetical protein